MTVKSPLMNWKASGESGQPQEAEMWLKITPQEPLILGDVRPDSQFLTGKHYVPARVVRGTWTEWLLTCGQDSSQILQTVGQLRIGNLFPAAESEGLLYALPLPITALTCKRYPGFRSEPNPERQGHGVLDTLLPRLAYRLLELSGVSLTVPFSLVCSKCNERMEAVGGFYAVYQGEEARHYVKFRPRFHAQTKVGLSHKRRASLEGMLYTAIALSHKTEGLTSAKDTTDLVFLGRVFGPRQAVNDLIAALDRIAIGALHNRGYGRVRAETADITLPPLRERVEKFNRLLSRCWEDIGQLAQNPAKVPPMPGGAYFAVTLLAPGVFYHDGTPTLKAWLHLGGRELEPVFWAARPDMASGWSSAWGLPKPTNLAARTGSVYVYRWEGDIGELIPFLEVLEQQGIGERREEGFGECLVCHPFHLEEEER